MLVHEALSSPSRRRPEGRVHRGIFWGVRPQNPLAPYPLQRRCRSLQPWVVDLQPAATGDALQGHATFTQVCQYFGMTNAYRCLLAIFSPFFTTKPEAKEKKKSPFE